MIRSRRYILLIPFIIFIGFFFITCEDINIDSINQETLTKQTSIVTEYYYKEWDFDKNEGRIRVAASDVESRDKVYYVKTDIQGKRIIKGFLYQGMKQDFWTYYDTKGEISKIEFYSEGKLKQTINYD